MKGGVGMRVGVVCTGDRPPRDDLMLGVNTLRECGLEVEVDEMLLVGAPSENPFHSDERRARALVSTFRDPDVDLVWSADGGFGAARLLRYLENEDFPAKPFVGFSDATALCLYLRTRGHETWYGMCVAAGEDDLFGLRRTASSLVTRTGHWTEQAECLFPGKRTGPLLGGNLSVFSQLVGTPYCPNVGDAILMLEGGGMEVAGEMAFLAAEDFQRIDLALSVEKGARPAALVLCDFNDIYPLHDGFPRVHEVLEAYCAPPLGHGRPALATGPVCLGGFEFGHSAPFVHPFPLGVEATLEVTPEQTTLTWECPR
jgi:muramoyltetrapeptide carboxypeptidase LdcA involved in peptidoglycan recycling